MNYQIALAVSVGLLITSCSQTIEPFVSAFPIAEKTFPLEPRLPSQVINLSSAAVEANVQPMSITYPRGGGGHKNKNRESEAARMHSLLHWNEMGINASGIDHEISQLSQIFSGAHEQLGPGRSSRALAIVHIAIFEAMNAIDQKYQSYLNLPKAVKETSMQAAIGQAAHDTLIALFPAQEESFVLELAAELESLPPSFAKDRGIELGKTAARLILALRAADGSQHPEQLIDVDYFPSDAPGIWRMDPISNKPLALGSLWGNVIPFVLEHGSQFRAPEPPALSSEEYALAFKEVKRLGGDGITTRTERTKDQTEMGIFWAYDGMPSLCAPPRLYNQVALTIARQMKSSYMETARLLALLNVTMADAGIAIWESKYHYQVWRPVTAIREADRGTGPTGFGDHNPQTRGDINFTPLGAPASNSAGPNFTPPFPAYPSGHAGFGGAIFQVLRRFYGTDDIAFTFTSDEFNGKTRDRTGSIRPLKPRSFANLSEAEEENGQSRIYLGIHWSFDKTGGIHQGRAIGDYIFDRLYQKKLN